MTVAGDAMGAHDKLRAYQFSLLQLVGGTAVATLLAWSYATFGLLPLLGLSMALPIGCISGGLIGFFHRAICRGALGGFGGAILSVLIAVTWWQVEIAKHGGIERFRTAPITAFFHTEVLLSLGAAALLGSVPVAAIAAVHDRGRSEVMFRSMVTCASAVFVGGVIFFAYDIWCRGGTPRPPIPWPIAFAIPLFVATGVAALVGLFLGVVWVQIRSQLRALRTRTATINKQAAGD